MSVLSLSVFPPEVLGQILATNASSFLVIALWKTGNRLLQAKLAEGVTYVNIVQHSALDSTYPLMLSQLRNLRHLLINTGKPLAKNPKALFIELQKLSQGLESLRISSPDAPRALLKVDRPSSPQPASSTQQGLGSTLQSSPGSSSSRLEDLEALFPKLTHFDVRQRVQPRMIILPSDYLGLPSTLTRLTVTRLESSVKSPLLMSFLPRALKTLEASVTVRFPSISTPQHAIMLDDWSKSPPELEEVTEIAFFNITTVEWMPRSLITVSCKEFGSHPWDAAMARSVPPKLESLTLSIPDYESLDAANTTWYNALPSCLTHLELVLDARDIQCLYIHASIIESLPRTLTSIKSDSLIFDWQSLREMVLLEGDEALEMKWPKNLWSLDYWLDQLLMGDLALLPDSLRHLNIHKIRISSDKFGGKPMCFNAKELPFSLQTLYFRANPEVPITFGECEAREMPQSLRSLVIESEFPGTGLKVESLEKLPNSLTSLNVRLVRQEVDEWLGERTIKLPTRLEELSISDWHARDFSSFPPTLRLLTITTLHGASDDTSAGTPSNIFQNLPPSIQMITVSTLTPISKPEFSPFSFSSLPALASIFLLGIGTFPASLLQHLPPKLTRICVTLQSFNASIDAPFLPPLLQGAQFGPELDWKDPILAQHWPVRAIFSIPPNMTVTSEIIKRRLKLTAH